MSRLKRLFVSNELHYLQRSTTDGCHFVTEDMEKILSVIAAQSLHLKLHIHAYSILPTSLHLLLTPETQQGVSTLMLLLGRYCSTHYNRRHKRYGNIWQMRYRAGIFQDTMFLDTAALIENLAVHEGIANHPADYRFSSYPRHCGLTNEDPWLHFHPAYLQLANTPFEREALYRQRFAPPPEELAANIRHASQFNWALGDAPFIASIEQRSQRRVVQSVSGRPRKSSKTN